MMHRQPAAIEDIYATTASARRIPPDFREEPGHGSDPDPDPVGAIGIYWARPHRAAPARRGVQLLQALADSTAAARQRPHPVRAEDRVRAWTADLEAANRQLERTNGDLLAAQHQADRVFAAYSRPLPGTVLEGKYRLDEEPGRRVRGRLPRPPPDPRLPDRHQGLPSRGGQRFGSRASTLLREEPPSPRTSERRARSGLRGFGRRRCLPHHGIAGGRFAGEGTRRTRAFLWACGVDIAGKVAEVLAAMHRQGILHRDIKPDNIFLHRGGLEVVKVVDLIAGSSTPPVVLMPSD